MNNDIWYWQVDKKTRANRLFAAMFPVFHREVISDSDKFYRALPRLVEELSDIDSLAKAVSAIRKTLSSVLSGAKFTSEQYEVAGQRLFDWLQTRRIPRSEYFERILLALVSEYQQPANDPGPGVSQRRILESAGILIRGDTLDPDADIGILDEVDRTFSRLIKEGYATYHDGWVKYMPTKKAIDEVRSGNRESLSQTGRVRILFLSADPTDSSRLRLGEEIREIQEKLQLAKNNLNCISGCLFVRQILVKHCWMYNRMLYTSLVMVQPTVHCVSKIRMEKLILLNLTHWLHYLNNLLRKCIALF